MERAGPPWGSSTNGGGGVEQKKPRTARIHAFHSLVSLTLCRPDKLVAVCMDRTDVIVSCMSADLRRGVCMGVVHVAMPAVWFRAYQQLVCVCNLHTK